MIAQHRRPLWRQSHVFETLPKVTADPHGAPFKSSPFLSFALAALIEHDPEFLRRQRPRIKRILSGEEPL